MKIKFKDILYIKGRIGWQALKKDEYLTNGDYYLITGVDIKENHLIDFSNCYFVSKERYEMDDKIQVHNGDIIVTKDGTIGKIGYIDKLDKPATLNSHLFLIRNLRKDILDSKFLFYLLQSNSFKKYAVNNTSGSNIPAFTQKNLEEFVYDLPSLEEQKNISNTIDLIDKKINTNIDINDNLQQMVYDIYMHDFLHKEPNGILSDIIIENSKSKTQVKDVKGKTGLYPFFTSGESIMKSNKYIIDGRNIFMNTGGNADVKFYVGKTDYSTDTWCITTNNNMTDYLYLHLLSIKNELNTKFFKGTGLKHLQKDLFRSKEIYIPTSKEIDNFNKISKIYFDKISDNYRENEYLIELRNYLLPLLMNGQISVA